ncbi:MAG: polyphosphate kinase 1 [Saprospiraceae bacterium]|nr:polyphosphate kinase 1 [Saprospiraceae bacterium]
MQDLLGLLPSTAHGFMKDKKLISRDISWLSFNARVLQEAADPGVPLLERLRFLAIYSSNLDEFYRVRIAVLRQLAQLGKGERRELDLRPRRELKQIREIVSGQLAQFGYLFGEEILPGLRREGLHILRREELTPRHLAFMEAFFRETLLSELELLSWTKGQAVPVLQDKQIYFVLGKSPYDELKFVRLPVPQVARFVELPSDKSEQREFVFADDIVDVGLPKHLSDSSLSCFAIKLSRDAELHIADEYAGDLLDSIRQGLERRSIGPPTRMLFDGQMPYLLVEQLKNLFQLDGQDLVPGARYHNFSDFMDFPHSGTAPHLSYPPLPPLPHPFLEQPTSLIKAVEQKDILLQMPYQRWDYIPALIREAAADPLVREIKITLYRIARQSVVVEALLGACREGKAVTVFIEAKARFDEASNLEAGSKLAQAGAKVHYSYPGIKVHAKLLLLVRSGFADRRNGEGADLVWMSTGNFNEKTARIYADYGLLSANPAYTVDVARVFDLLERRILLPRCQQLLVAPFQLREELTKLLETEIKHQREGKTAWVLLKMNSLEDPEMIEKLYAVAQSGVSVRLIIRGICCLLPGVPQLSDNIQAISIVDRFLEHARVFVFANGGQPKVYLSSADWMTRNLDRRVEIAWPVLDHQLSREILAHLDMQWSDNTKARLLDAEHTNSYRDVEPGQTRVRAQLDHYHFLQSQVN